MSHFACMVLGPNVDKQLAPYEESLEVEWVNETENYREEYETKKTKEFYCGSSSSWGQQITKELFDFIKSNKPGAIHKYTVEKETSGLGSYFKLGKKYRGYYPIEVNKRCEGDAWFELVSVDKTTHPDADVCFEGEITIRVIEPPKEISLKEKYPSYETYLKDWHGQENMEEQGYWTNPKAKWDWYQVGGRWSNFLKVREGKEELAVHGQSSLIYPQPPEEGYADQISVGDIDFTGMMKEASDKAGEHYDKINELCGGEIPKVDILWENVWDKGDDAQQSYKTQPGVLHFNESIKGENLWVNVDDYQKTKEEYMKDASNRALSTYAMVEDGKWYAKGEMGWFGCSTDDVSQEEWNKQMVEKLMSLPDNTLITIVDCHI